MTRERVEQAARSFLADHSDLESALETLLDRQRETDAWAFDDASLDSGRFGELVSREFVEKTDDGQYRFVDAAAVESALSGDGGSTTDTPAATTASTTGSPTIARSFSLPTVNGTALAAVAAALALVAAIRMMYYSAVFRDGRVVSPANDPYYYRSTQESLLEQSGGLTDFGTLATVGEETTRRPLTHALNWWLAELFGDTPAAVAAWQPVVASLLLALVLYLLVVTLTADRRIALAALLFLAFTPVHAVYTSLGFLEHRSYQYLWLVALAFALVWLAVDLRRRLDRSAPGGDARAATLDHVRAPRTWAVAAVLALAVAASAHAWGGSPLTFVPVALYLALRAVADVERGVPPLLANAPALVGIGAGTLLAALAHAGVGWHESIAVTVPALVATGGVAVALLGSAWRSLQLPSRGLLAVEGVFAAVFLLAFRQLRPADVARLQERADDLFGREGITETSSLFAADQAVILGPLAQIGVGFYLGLAALAFLTWLVSRRYEPGWLVLVCFAWSYLVLAAFQVRFAAQLSVFVAVFAGVALVYLLGAVDLARPPALFDAGGSDRLALPGRTRAAYLVAVVGFVLLLNLVFVPTLLGQVQHDDGAVEAATAIADHNRSTGADHPEYVLSQWGDNRLYNYVLSGDAESYSYARNTYEGFVTAGDPDDRYSDFSNRVGYVVLTAVDAPEDTTHNRLFENLGAGNDSVAHYQLLYSSDDVRAFALVEGAVISVTTSPEETVTARTDVTTAGESLTYERTETAAENGTAHLRVAYPGEYEVGGETVTVTERDVHEGRDVSPDD